MNNKTIIASLAFGLVSASSMAVEAVRTEVPVAKLERMEVRAQIKRAVAAGELASNESFGSFAYSTLHGQNSTLTRAAVMAEMSQPRWQALIAAPSDAYNDFRGDTGSALSRTAARAEAMAAAESSRNSRLYAGG